MQARSGGKQISEFKANLLYRVSSRTARATKKNPVLKRKKKKKKKRQSLAEMVVNSFNPALRKERQVHL